MMVVLGKLHLICSSYDGSSEKNSLHKVKLPWQFNHAKINFIKLIIMAVLPHQKSFHKVKLHGILATPKFIS